MARIGISITKEVAFRDSIQPFSNMYFYTNGGGAIPTEAQAGDLIDELVAIEKTLHSTSVEFTFARLWKQGLTQLDSFMINQKALTGQGSTTLSSSLDRERAFLFRLRAGSDSRGQPVYLRKYYHACGNFPGATNPLTAGQLANQSGFSTAERAAMGSAVNAVTDLAAAGGGWLICSKVGREPTENNWQAHRYLEHHQLGDQWRGA